MNRYPTSAIIAWWVAIILFGVLVRDYVNARRAPTVGAASQAAVNLLLACEGKIEITTVDNESNKGVIVTCAEKIKGASL